MATIVSKTALRLDGATLKESPTGKVAALKVTYDTGETVLCILKETRIFHDRDQAEFVVVELLESSTLGKQLTASSGHFTGGKMHLNNQPPYCRIEKDASGQPTGVSYVSFDEAFQLIDDTTRPLLDETTGLPFVPPRYEQKAAIKEGYTGEFDFFFSIIGEKYILPAQQNALLSKYKS